MQLLKKKHLFHLRRRTDNFMEKKSQENLCFSLPKKNRLQEYLRICTNFGREKHSIAKYLRYLSDKQPRVENTEAIRDSSDLICAHASWVFPGKKEATTAELNFLLWKYNIKQGMQTCRSKRLYDYSATNSRDTDQNISSSKSRKFTWRKEKSFICLDF